MALEDLLICIISIKVQYLPLITITECLYAKKKNHMCLERPQNESQAFKVKRVQYTHSTYLGVSFDFTMQCKLF